MPTSRVRCPEFLPGFTWINARRPLSVAGDLRGRVAVLDFWTYCCINCMHVLPVLRRVEERFAKDPVVVIGVHSAKFISEKDPQNVRRAVERNGVTHPVVVDSEHDIWERFAVRSWPTLVLVDAGGYVRDTISGEIDETTLAGKIDALLAEGRDKGILAASPLDVSPDPDADRTFLRFPGKVHVAKDRLFITDAGHHRLIVADLDGRVQAVVGEGGAGAHDGPAPEASFHNPQGMTADDQSLYVADTGNHLLRGVDLSTLEVTTLAGRGVKGEGRGLFDFGDEEGPPDSVLLQHPLDVAVGSGAIYVADTYNNKIKAIAFGSMETRTVFGDGDRKNLYEPGGLAVVGEAVFIADTNNHRILRGDPSTGTLDEITPQGQL